MESGASLIIAARAGYPRVIEELRRKTKRSRSRVITSQVRVEHLRVVRGDRALNACRDQTRQRVFLDRADRAGPDVRDRADIEHDATFRDLAQQFRILHGPNSVT